MKKPKFYRKFDYRKQLLPNHFLASLEDGVNNIEEARKRTGATIGYPGWNLVYYILLSHLRPDKWNTILETGTNEGCSTIVLAQALKDSNCEGRVYTVELDEDNHAKAKENFGRAGLNHLIDLRLGDSKSLLKELKEELGGFRVAFLDASHLIDDVYSEFEIVYPALEEDSIVIFDNTYQIAEDHEDQRVFGALHKIKQVYGGNLINFEFVSWYTPGMAIWQKKPFPMIDTPPSPVSQK